MNDDTNQDQHGTETPETTSHDYNSRHEPGDGPAGNGKMVIFAVLALAVVAALAWFAFRSGKKDAAVNVTGPVAATAPAAEKPKTIATADGIEITDVEFRAAVESLPEQMRGQADSPEGKKQILDELVRVKLLEREARRLGVDSRPDVAARVNLSAGNILATAALEQLVAQAKNVTPEQLYERNKSQFERVKARQMVIVYDGSQIPPRSGKPRTQAEAKAKADQIVASLRAGGSFSEIAKKESDEPTVGETGGELGEVARGMLPDELANPMFALQPNQTADPVNYRNAYFVFQVTERKMPTFDEMKQLFEQQGDRVRAKNVIDDLVAKAKVNIEPSFLAAK